MCVEGACEPGCNCTGDEPWFEWTTEDEEERIRKRDIREEEFQEKHKGHPVTGWLFIFAYLYVYGLYISDWIL
ncbi:hypothetical protein CMI37_37545 [Candidatus Pacearchaeota archaeon]|nr:hypothetical protein [Candidatus Pacearchaeota archaeon]|tara:strand:+ start:1209 stop:1427 length:219 start_codon:yes stop_codon:yes gene_type:complete